MLKARIEPIHNHILFQILEQDESLRAAHGAIGHKREITLGDTRFIIKSRRRPELIVRAPDQVAIYLRGSATEKDLCPTLARVPSGASAEDLADKIVKALREFAATGGFDHHGLLAREQRDHIYTF